MVNACKVIICILSTFLLNTCNAMDLNKEINQNDKIMQNNIETIHNNNLNNNRKNTNKQVKNGGLVLSGVQLKLFNNEQDYINRLKNINVNDINDLNYIKILKRLCIGSNCELKNTKNPDKFKKLFNKNSKNFNDSSAERKLVSIYGGTLDLSEYLDKK